MFYVNEIKNSAPAEYKRKLQKMTYPALSEIQIPFERVDTEDIVKKILPYKKHNARIITV